MGVIFCLCESKYRIALMTVLALLCGACAQPKPREVTPVREVVDAAKRPAPVNVTSAERFGFAPADTRRSENHSLALTWKVPQGWEVLPTGGMRVVGFRIGERSECSVTILAGIAGGLEANVNRWRAQMGLAPMSAEEIAALPTVTILGVASPLVELTGTFAGMSGSGEPDWALLGAICVLPENSVFIKATGPAEELLPQRDAFLQFCQSIGKATPES